MHAFAKPTKTYLEDDIGKKVAAVIAKCAVGSCCDCHLKSIQPFEKVPPIQKRKSHHVKETTGNFGCDPTVPTTMQAHPPAPIPWLQQNVGNIFVPLNNVVITAAWVGLVFHNRLDSHPHDFRNFCFPCSSTSPNKCSTRYAHMHGQQNKAHVRGLPTAPSIAKLSRRRMSWSSPVSILGAAISVCSMSHSPMFPMMTSYFPDVNISSSLLCISCAADMGFPLNADPAMDGSHRNSNTTDPSALVTLLP